MDMNFKNFKLRDNRRAFFFTISVILLIIPLLFLITFYLNIRETSTKDAISRMRCDELHYLVEDIRKDLSRAVTIFGRRAAVYAVDHVVSNGVPLADYEFTCTSLCPVDCNTFFFENNGSSAAIAELVLCGTLYGENVTYMVNHTMNEWIDRIIEKGKELHFNISMKVDSINVVPEDAWHFHLIINTKTEIYDESELCHFSNKIISITSNTSIIGLEDPLYALNTGGHIFKQIIPCNADLRLTAVAGCSKTDSGYGNFTGEVIFYSSFTGLNDLADYCNETSQEILGQQVLVVDQAWGTVCNNQRVVDCLNASQPKHFGALILYESASESNVSSCMPSIPWISDTGEMDNQTPYGGGSRKPGCDDAIITNGSCIAIVNDPSCNLHYVYIAYDIEDINTTCYYVSNISRYSLNCTPSYTDGPSFFDRLDGNLNLSEKYVEQALRYFNNSEIGIESLVDFMELVRYSSVYPEIKIYENASWIDYLYWQNVSGCRVLRSCPYLGYEFNLDCQHAHSLGIGTTCTSVDESYCPTEICVDCIDQDNDGLEDWNDPDCGAYFSSGCGEVHYCDPSDTDICPTCDTPMPPEIPDNSSNYCNYYGFNTTEWHLYRIVPDITGRLIINFSGTGKMPPGNLYRSDLSLYNYSDLGCTSPSIATYQLEPSYGVEFCVEANKTYIIAIDVDSNNCTHYGHYLLNTTIVADPIC